MIPLWSGPRWLVSPGGEISLELSFSPCDTVSGWDHPSEAREIPYLKMSGVGKAARGGRCWPPPQ